MFKGRYQKAYDKVTPSPELIADTIEKARAGKSVSQKKIIGKTTILKRTLIAAAAVLFFVLVVPVAAPVCAAHIPAFYKIVEYLSPTLADQLVPIEESSTSQGITMQVEAIHLEGNEAEIIVSFRDAEGSTQDLVHGEMDLFDSYGLSDYANDSWLGGCIFLTYDENDDKAYFEVAVQADHAYQSNKLRFSVNSVLCDKYHDTRDVDLCGIVYSAETKRVMLSGSGGPMTEEMLPDFLQDVSAAPEDPRSYANVLDMMSVTDCAADDFTITGIAYMDGVLRVQVCMGDNWNNDRHVQLFLKDSEGNERYEDHSVSWHEDVGDTSFQIYEFWYLEDIDDIADHSMYGIFHSAGNLVEGDWNVTFRVQ